MLRILAQRVPFTDAASRIKQDWFVFLSDIANAVNKRSTQASAAASEVTGTTDETSLATINVGPYSTGSVVLTMATTCTNNANAKTITIKINGTTAQSWSLDASTDTQTIGAVIVWRSASSLYVVPSSAHNCAPSGGQEVAVTSGSNLQIEISGTLALFNDSVRLEAWAMDVSAI